MRKTKELKRMRREAGLAFRRGKKADAYKQWKEAAKGYAARLAAKRKTKAAEGEAAA